MNSYYDSPCDRKKCLFCIIMSGICDISFKDIHSIWYFVLNISVIIYCHSYKSYILCESMKGMRLFPSLQTTWTGDIKMWKEYVPSWTRSLSLLCIFHIHSIKSKCKLSQSYKQIFALTLIIFLVWCR